MSKLCSVKTQSSQYGTSVQEIRSITGNYGTTVSGKMRERLCEL
jgi:hypothetical protein